MAHTRTWSELTPADADLAKNGARDMRYVRTDLKERIALEHSFAADDDDGYHLEGSARAYVASGAPTPPTGFEEGRIWVDSDTGVVYYHTGAAWVALASKTSSIQFIIDGGGVVIPTGIKGDIVVPFACTITKVVALADQSGSIVIDIWKDTYANHPPTDADSITASAPPTITTAVKSSDSTLTDWTVTLAVDDILRFNVDSCTTITRCTLALTVTRL